MRDPEYTYRVRVSLTDNDNIPNWDKICISAIELFGLPGERYITDIANNYMDWIFKDSKDALIFKLKFSEVSN